MFEVTERLFVDPDVAFSTDLDRCVFLINGGQTVAVGTFTEAELILRQLGMTIGSIVSIFETVAERQISWNPADAQEGALGALMDRVLLKEARDALPG